MIITIESARADISLPSEKEIKNAVGICCGRCCVACETPVEYAWRKRTLDLAYLVGLAVRRELTDSERDYIKAVYYEGKSRSEVSAEKGVSLTAVYRALSRAERKLRKALDYVIIYQNELEGGEGAESFLQYAIPVNAARYRPGEEVSEKLRNMRAARAIPSSVAAKALGIERGRLLDIESGAAEPLAEEVLGLCEIYGTVN